MPSPREQVAQNLLDVCIFGGLNEVYGADLSKRTDKKNKTYWSVSFCKARVLDGTIKVYSEKFILISWQTAYRTLPEKGNEVFKNETDAKKFLHQFIMK